MVKESEVVRNPKREAMGVILLALCLLSFLCIFSFNAEDIGELHYPPAIPPHNLVGPLGAWCAYYIAFLPFGVSGYLLPFILLTGGLLMTLRSFVRVWPIWTWLTVGFISLASFMEYQPSWWNGLRETLNVGSPGGTVGQLLAVRTLGRLINHTGAGIIFFTMFCLSVLQLTGMHPFTPFLFLWDRIKYLYTRRKRIKPSEPIEKPARKEKPAKKPLKNELPDIEPVMLELSNEPVAKPEIVIKQEPKPAPKPEPVKVDIPKPEPVKTELPKVEQPKVEQPKVEPPKPLKPKPVVVPEPDDLQNVTINIASGSDASGYKLPSLSLLDELPPLAARTSNENTEEKARILQATLEQFGVEATITHIETGPTVTSYEITPAAGVRVEKITALERNIALALKAQSIRIQAPIPGKGAVGIEIPNTKGTAV
ncbi:MAG: hypothetical protein FJ220_03765 [Kiritimatiellaceae bacterium]|nr:hypothetical protein [Kiritimatiellaceae bacterium]